MRIYGSLCVLFLLYLIRANVAERENHTFPGTINVERISSVRSIEDLNKDSLNIVDKFRDKRALGLILSGLAQVFGYTVTPIQIASLPNPADNNAGATGNNQSSSMPPMQSSPSPPSSSPPPQTTPMSTTTPAPPRQRETIRFTGVVNFGNRSDILGHLQQYERIFHGGGSTGATPSPMPSSSSSSSSSSPPAPPSTMSSQNMGDSLKYKPPLLTPFLVRIPLPIASNLPPPMSPASEMINYSYMSTPRRKEQETVYRKNEDLENYSVENKEIQSEKEVETPESKYRHNLYIDEPYWKKLHEERIAQLERQQQEHTERLKEQEQDHSYSEEDDSGDEETDERSKDREKENYDHEKKNYDRERENSESAKEEKDESEDEDKEEEDENSREQYEEHPGYPREHPGYPRERPPNEKLQDQGNQGYKDYDEDDSYRNYERYEDSKEPNSRAYDNNYTNVNYNQPLPISDYYEREKPPQQLRDSYGEIVNNQGLIDERIANYFDTIKNQQNGVHISQKVPEIVNVSGEKYEEKYGSKKNKENDEDPYKRIRDEYAIPFIENRYEEYNIDDNEQSEKENEDETENRKYVNDDDRYVSSPNTKNQAQSNDSTMIVDKTMQIDSNGVRSKKVSRFHNNVSPITSKPFEDFAFVKHTPYILPIRYAYGPEELEEARTRRFNPSKLKKDSNSRSTADVGKSVRRRPKAEDLAPKIGLPERLTARKLHEGETKASQFWPAPFDFVFDSTEQTNVIIPSNIKENSDENAYHMTNIPTRTVTYEKNTNSVKYLAPSIPVHYAIY